MQTSIEIVPPRAFQADVSVPGSKSLTNRALVCAALAEGKSRIGGVSRSEDSRILLDALRKLGVKIEPQPGLELAVVGKGPSFEATAVLDMGNAGTSLRFVTALVALGKGEYMVTGDDRMRERPIAGLVDALRRLGAKIDYHGTPGCPPLHVMADGLAGGRVEVEGRTSSQFLSALLLISPYTQTPLDLVVPGDLSSKGYADMTRQVMAAFGAPAKYRPTEFRVEADAAAAGYWFAMGAVAGRANVAGIGSACRQPEIGLLADLKAMGATVDMQPAFTEVRSGALKGIDVDMNDRPDSVPALAVAALFAKGATRIRNVAHLRHKETDRLAALSHELGKLGARVIEHRDGLEIDPSAKLTPATIETYKDHRMAMSFAIAGLVAEGIVIKDPGCVGKSYPNFWQTLKQHAELKWS